MEILVIGSIIAAYGITLELYAGFGGATLAVLWQMIARTFHISIGTASFVVALGMILLALIYDKSHIHIGTVLFQIVYSTCVDLFAVGTGLYASASLGRGSYEAVTFALAEEITGRLNLSEWHWIFWLLLQVFCLAESLVYASQFIIDSILPSRTIGTAFLFYANSKHDILSNEIVLMRNGYNCY